MPHLVRLNYKDVGALVSGDWHFGHLVTYGYHAFTEEQSKSAMYTSVGRLQSSVVGSLQILINLNFNLNF